MKTDGNLPPSTRRWDWTPVLLLPIAGVVGLLLTPSLSTWITLTTAGLAMGMLIFLVASGLTVVFGLMDVLNFGHGAFITVGAYAAFTAMAMTPGLVNSPALSDNFIALLVALAAAAASGAIVGLLFERLFVRKVYGDHLKQILVTMARRSGWLRCHPRCVAWCRSETRRSRNIESWSSSLASRCLPAWRLCSREPGSAC
jgi:hypothetical protein